MGTISDSDRAERHDLAPNERAPRVNRRGSIGQLVASGYVTLAFGLITGPITARVLGPGGRGEVAAATVYAAMIAVVASVGLPNAVGYWLATGRSTASALLAAVIRFALLISPLAVVGGVYAGVALRQFSPAGRLGVAVLIGLVPVVVVGFAVEAMIRARGELGVLARTRLVALGLPALATVGLWLTGTLSVLSMTATSVVTMAVVMAYVCAQLGARPRRRESLPPLLRYGCRSILGGTAIAVSGRLDQAIIGPVLGPSALGLYAVAATVSALPLALSYAVSARAFAEVGRAEEAERVNVAASYVRLSVVVTVPAVLALAAVIPFAMPLVYGSSFQGSVVPTLLLLPSIVAASFLAAAEAGMNGLGRPGRASAAEGAGTVVGLVALVLLLRPMGISGAAIATSFDFFVSATIIGLFLRRLGARQLLPRRADLVLVIRIVRGRLSRASPNLPVARGEG